MGDGIRILTTLLKRVILQKEWLTTAANDYTNGQGRQRSSMNETAGAGDAGKAVDKREHR